MFGWVFSRDLTHSLVFLPQTHPENLCLLSIPYLVNHHCAGFPNKTFWTFWRFSKLIAKLGLHNSFTCLESSYPVIRVTWPIVRWVGAWLHVLYKLLHFDIGHKHQHLRFSFQGSFALSSKYTHFLFVLKSFSSWADLAWENCSLFITQEGTDAGQPSSVRNWSRLCIWVCEKSRDPADKWQGGSPERTSRDESSHLGCVCWVEGANRDISHLVFPVFSVGMGGKKGDIWIFKNSGVFEKPLRVGR